jgi:hypothetical protein
VINHSLQFANRKDGGRSFHALPRRRADIKPIQERPSLSKLLLLAFFMYSMPVGLRINRFDDRALRKSAADMIEGRNSFAGLPSGTPMGAAFSE